MDRYGEGGECSSRGCHALTFVGNRSVFLLSLQFGEDLALCPPSVIFKLARTISPHYF